MDEWKTEIRTSGGAVQDYTISYQNLDPETTYYFRVIAYNEYGISEPCTNDETVSVECPFSFYFISPPGLMYFSQRQTVCVVLIVKLSRDEVFVELSRGEIEILQ